MDKKSCHARHAAGDVPLTSLNTDAVDFGFLSAARYFFISFSECDASAWVMTMLSSESFFPGPDSAEKMRRSLAVVHEMRTSRRSMFRFSNPRCQGCSAIVTQDERYLLQLIQNARAGHGSQVASSAMLLCEGNSTERVIAAAYGFADLVSKRRARLHA